MKIRFLLLALLIPASPFAPRATAQEFDGSDVDRQLREHDAVMGRLSLDEQLKLRAAQTKATEDPKVQEAFRKRNEAINEFRATLRAAMIKADPTVEPILTRVSMPALPTGTPAPKP